MENNDKKAISSRYSEAINFIIDTGKAKNKKEVAEKLNIQQSKISEILKNRQSPTIKDLAEICRVYYIDEEWLMNGRGGIESRDNSSKVGIPLIPVEAMAGWGGEDVQVMDYEASRYVVPDFEELQVDYMIRVKGSSMYPKYNSGDIVACRVVQDSQFIKWHDVYVLDTRTQGAMVKRLHPSELEDHVTCVSDNDKYPPFDVPWDEVNAIALVVGVIRFQ